LIAREASVENTLNPISVYSELRESYLRYLGSRFYCKKPELHQEIAELFRRLGTTKGLPLVRPPILQVSPRYKHGASVEELISRGLVNGNLRRAKTGALPERLYAHQEAGISKAVRDMRNLTVATGTGSGKTEIFLIPILNHLLEEAERGTLVQPGPRALLLYPMNALANDQMGRLRSLLTAFPDITFGRYTGETKQTRQEARDLYRSRHGQEPLPNEILSRDEMQQSPPHILLTNYAMLEYLLIRPADAPLFDGGRWRFIVLDEVHTYSGAKGVEIAMLLRRFKDRVGVREPGTIQCFGTSATLGNGRRDHPAIARFAAELFAEQFTSEDVIEPEYEDEAQDLEPWGSGSLEGYQTLQRAVASEPSVALETMNAEALRHFPEKAVSAAYEIAVQQTDNDQTHPVRVFLGALLQGDRRLQDLRAKLSKDGLLELTGGQEDRTDVTLVGLAAHAVSPGDHRPLLAARYHILARALDGAWVWFDEGGKPHVTETRERVHVEDGHSPAMVFELGVCKRCGEPFLVGVEKDELLVQPSQGHEPEKLTWLALRSAEDLEAVNEDDLIDAEVAGEDISQFRAGVRKRSRFERNVICRRCGRLRQRSGALDPCGDHDFDGIEVLKVEAKKEDRRHPCCCPSCGNFFAGTATQLVTGKENPVAVLATALYRHVPTAKDRDEAELPGGGRKLIMFSDSRQDAAFFAPFMDRSYGVLRQRRYLALALDASRTSVDLDDWVTRARRVAESAGEWDPDTSRDVHRREVARWVMRDFAPWDRRQSLEGTGVVRYVLRKPSTFRGLDTLSGPPWNLSVEDQWALLTALFNTLRSRQAISLETTENAFLGVEWSDEIFRPRDRAYYVSGAAGNLRKGILSWEPPANGSNGRHDFLKRVLREVGLDEDEVRETAFSILGEIWRQIEHPNGPLAAVFERGLTVNRQSNLCRLKLDMWQVKRVDEDDDVFRCDVCGTVTSTDVLGVCPMYRCPGRLQPYSPHERRDNHFFHLFTSMEPVPMRTAEHTAQLEKNEAYTVQRHFMEGRVNFLSCTTTFEMGVDLGGLEAVLMHNVPPSPSNYIQRAGRAGRRRGAAAVIVTYAQRRSHDFAYFQRWKDLVGGTVRPPVFRLENGKIVRRHIHAEALGAFFRANPEIFRDRLDAVFDPQEQVPETIRAFLQSHPQELLARLKRIVPDQLHSALGLDSWSWLDEESEDGSFFARLERAENDVHSDWKHLEDAERLAVENKAYGRAGAYKKQLTTLKMRSLLGKLGTYGLIPKYGFPTDVVELKIQSGEKDALSLELARDLRLAVSEYAPENQVVAGGKVWTSRGVVIPPGRSLHEFRYWHCSACGYFDAKDVVATDEEQPAPRVCNCGKECQASRYLYPEFGFTTALGSGAPVGDARPPYRSYAGTFFQRAHEESRLENLGELPGVGAALATDNWIHVINEGQSNGFFLCDRCGYAQVENPAWSSKKSRDHVKPWSREKCQGHLRKISLGHRYQTDTLELKMPPPPWAVSDPLWLSVLYAILKGAGRALTIDEHDIDGCLHHGRGSMPSLVLFDTSPGGAGIVREIRQDLLTTLEAAGDVTDCSACSEDTSCISCLRTYWNQRHHGVLRRGDAGRYLEWLLTRNIHDRPNG